MSCSEQINKRVCFAIAYIFTPTYYHFQSYNMLLGSFYNIKELVREGQTFRVKVDFNAAHEIFKGHFPDLPVVPGVCQTQMLLEILNHALARPIEMKLAHHIKFLALLNPTKVSELTCDIKIDKEEGEKLFVSASYFTPEEMFFRFKGEFVNG